MPRSLRPRRLAAFDAFKVISWMAALEAAASVLAGFYRRAVAVPGVPVPQLVPVNWECTATDHQPSLPPS
jgi:hypothetical protein